MVENIVQVCHAFPAVSPVDVWRLRYDVWCRFLQATAQIEREREANR